MNYYTSHIPLPLAEKLEEKGMPYIDIDCDTFDEGTEYQRDDVWCNNTYAEVFDWLMEKGYVIIIKPYWNTDSWESYAAKISETDMPKAGREIYVQSTWHEAADKAIEKALTLLQ